jgi:hypothetical protein
MMKFLFVGERPSHQAARISATWHNGKLAAKQLHDALRALNIEPAEQRYVNLWRTPGTGPIKAYPEVSALAYIAESVALGYTVVGMGQIVSRELARRGITHLLIVHPAARGAIRKKERYTAHVEGVLFGTAQRQAAKG